MKKNNLVLLLSAVFVLLLNVCGMAFAQSEEEFVIYPESKIFTQEELQAAAKVFLAEFNTWEGCEMHHFVYAGDDMSQAELEYVKANYEEPYDEVAKFISGFRSPKTAYGAWEPDKEYVYTWTLARIEKGDWKLINYGWDTPFVKSAQFTEEEMTNALNVIYAETDRMEGVRNLFIKYLGDEFSSGELEYVNSLERGSFDECAVFSVWFQSPVEAYGAWEPDTLYEWTFYLARANKGEWQLLTYGN